MRPGARAFAAVATDVRRVRFRGASHLANLDRPAAFNGAVRRFARSLDGR
jgi:pimeloyl-ACP methyl ester carboxylesterase